MSCGALLGGFGIALALIVFAEGVDRFDVWARANGLGWLMIGGSRRSAGIRKRLFQLVAGGFAIWFFYSHPGFSASEGDSFLLGERKRGIESKIKMKRLSGVLMLCGDDAGDLVTVATVLRLYPPDLGVPSPDVISALEASAKRIIRFEEGRAV